MAERSLKRRWWTNRAPVGVRAWAFACIGALAMPVDAAPPPRPPRPVTAALPEGIERWTLRELEIARARPLAERGAVFRSAWLDRYFRRQPWYRPTGFDPRRLPRDEAARTAALARYRSGLSRAELDKKAEALRGRQQRLRANCPLAVAVGGVAAAERVVVLEPGGVKLWDLAAGTSRTLMPTPSGAQVLPRQIAITRDGARVRAVEEVNHVAQVSSWDWASLRALPAFQWSDTSSRYHLPSDTYTLSTDGSSVLAPDPRGPTWRLVSPDDPTRTIALSAKSMFGAAERVAVTEDFRRVLAVAAGRAWLWRPSTPARGAIAHTPLDLGPARDADLSATGRLLALVNDSTVPYLAHANAPERKTALVSAIAGGFDFVAFAPGEHKLLAGTRSLGFAVWEVQSGKLVHERPAQSASLRCAERWAAFLPDGHHVVLAGEGGGFEVVDLRTGQARVIARDRALPPQEDDRIEAALLARATNATASEQELAELSFEAQPLALEQPLTEQELLATAKRGVDLRSLEVLIQARRGRSFRSPRWSAYARAQRWYQVDPRYSEARLTGVDRENLALLKRLREKLAPRPPRPLPDVVSSAPPSAFPACPTGSVRVDRSDGDRAFAACVTQRQGKDVLQGPEWIWFPTGRLSEARAWLDGRAHGPAMTWYFTGVRASFGAYERGARDGAFVKYHRNGRPALRAEYTNGAPDGPWTAFYDNGQRAIALTFRAGVPDPRVPSERFSPDGKRWATGVKVTSCDAPSCVSPIAQLDFDSLPEAPVDACAEGLASFDQRLPRARWTSVLAAAKQAWPADAGGGAIPGPGACVDSIRLACAPDLNGDAIADVLAEVSYRIVLGAKASCLVKSNESWPMTAIVALSPPKAGEKAWSQHGVLAYPTCGADVCPGPETLHSFVLLPSGETGVRLSVVSGGGDCTEREYEQIRTPQGGAWRAVAARTTRECDGTREPEENDVY